MGVSLWYLKVPSAAPTVIHSDSTLLHSRLGVKSDAVFELPIRRELNSFPLSFSNPSHSKRIQNELSPGLKHAVHQVKTKL